MQQEWTPTEPELDALVRATARHHWRAVAIPGSVLVVGIGFVAAALSGGGLGLLLLAVGALWLGWSGYSALRGAREVLGTAYPVGTTVSAEATEDGLVLHTARGRAEFAWERFGRPRLGPVVLIARDRVTKRWLMVPRQLFPEAWLDRVGAAARDA